MRFATRLSTAVALAGCAGAVAEVRQWNNPLGGLWSDAANWSPMDVPDTATEGAIVSLAGDYPIRLDQSVTVSGLELLNVGASISVGGGSSVTVAMSGSWMALQGVLQLNPERAERLTQVQLLQGETFYSPDGLYHIYGGGTLRLHAPPGGSELTRLSIQYAENSYLALSDSTSIAGSGTMDSITTTDGSIYADDSEAALVFPRGVSSSGLVTAIGGARLSAASLAVFDGGTLQLGNDGSSIQTNILYTSNATIRNESAAPLTPHEFICWNALLVGAVQTESAFVGLGGLTNDGILTIRPPDSESQAFLAIESFGASIGGRGVVRLDVPAERFDAVHVTAEAIGTIGTPHQEAGHSLEGSGSVECNVVNGGRIAAGLPGDPIGRFEFADVELIQSTDAILEIDLGGTTFDRFDRISGQAAISLGGTLRVRLIDAFTPGIGDEFAIVSGATVAAHFEHVEMPSLSGDVRLRVRYEPTAAVIVATCPTDLDGDLMTGLPDLAMLLVSYGMESSDAAADVNGDGVVDMSDLSLVIGGFGARCER